MFKGTKKLIKMILFIAIIILGIYLAINIKYPKTYSDIVLKYAQEYNIDKNIIYSIIDKESKFHKAAVSDKGAIGLMQIMPDTAEELANELDLLNYDLTNPDDNIRIGSYYIKKLINKYDGNLIISLAAYNAGMGNVANWITDLENFEDIESIPVNETKAYVKDVLKNYKMYHLIYDKYRIPPIDIKDEHIDLFHVTKDFFKGLRKKVKTLYEKI
ncbi:MAG: lytic transglycosylase domain-containing protein [Tissierellia bacterium]|nr:lytic transglycosylase domain-containing protein [Tissierellia bacterium]